MSRKNAPFGHPGRRLRALMVEFGLTQQALADHIGVKSSTISGIMTGERSISVMTALKLGRAFGMTGNEWLSWQQDYDLMVALRDHEEELVSIKNIGFYEGKPF